MNLSEFHFNRLFRRWAGVTPRQYLAFVDRAGSRAARCWAPAQCSRRPVGRPFGPGRLHDLMVTLEAVTPGELKAGGAGITLTAGFAATPLGVALLADYAAGPLAPEPSSSRAARQQRLTPLRATVAAKRRWCATRRRADTLAARDLGRATARGGRCAWSSAAPTSS